MQICFSDGVRPPAETQDPLQPHPPGASLQGLCGSESCGLVGAMTAAACHHPVSTLAAPCLWLLFHLQTGSDIVGFFRDPMPAFADRARPVWMSQESTVEMPLSHLTAS